MSNGREETPDPAAVAVSLGRPRDGERVLDLSGRAGSLALRVAPRAASVESVQTAEGLAEEGRRLAKTVGRTNVYFHESPLAGLPFDEGQFDLAFWCMGLSREGRPLAALGELARVLTAGGRAVLQDVTAFGRAAVDLKVWELERRRSPDHLLFYTEEQVRALVEEAGLEVKRTERSATTLDFDYWAASAAVSDDEVSQIKQTFFNMPLDDQDVLDLALADGRILFSYPVLSLLVETA